MNLFKKMWKTRKTRIWMIVCPVVLILALVISLVVTLNPLISGTLDIAFGGDKAIKGEDREMYVADYQSKADAKKAAEAFSEDVVREGITLLKNENHTLPLQEGKRKVTVFGKNSVNPVLGGSGSSATSTDGSIGIIESLKEAGFSINPTLEAFYRNNSKSGNGRGKAPAMGTILSGMITGETPISSYDASLRQSYQDYHDAAIVVISRSGGEGYDLPRTMKSGFSSDATKIEGARNADDHYLQLDQNETDLLKEACDNFENVIVVLNTAQVMELGFLDDTSHYAYQEKIKACLWMGLPAQKGAIALGEVLSGKVNPSGRTVDTYVRDFKKDPTWQNFGNNNKENGNAYLTNNADTGYRFVEYEEGIYSGYRYYETKAHDMGAEGETWYKNNVVYPFGYGLSYTQFEWSVKWPEITSFNSSEQQFNVEVTVKNTGENAGKDVVELYYSAPYTEGGIEKSHVNLGAFAKTGLLSPDQSETLTLTLKAEDMKSYDYLGKNRSDYKGYLLEKGDYNLKVGHDAHHFESDRDFRLDKDILLENDTTTGTIVTNRFDDVSSKVSVMKRNDMETTFPKTPSDEERNVTSEFIASLTYKKDDEGKPWYVSEDKKPTQADKIVSEPTLKLGDLVGLDYDDGKWDELLDQLTVEQMSSLIGKGAYGSIAIENIGKPLTNEPDGPSGFTSFMAMSDTVPVYGCASYPAETVLASTWNRELARKMGALIGNEGLIGNERGDGLPYSGWYAPAVNVHRSPFGGRNWEYYSEDPYLSGIMGTEVVLGAKTKGVYCFVKHFAINEQETNRDTEGCLNWLDEQTMREIYLKPFEMIVKDGKTTAMMSSFTRIGTVWAGGNYQLLTSILRNEWGFRGEVVTDYNLSRYMNQNQMIRAGGDLVLNQEGKNPSLKDTSATQITAMRNATHNILYTVCNSCATNSEIIGYRMADWKVLLIVVDIAVFLAMSVYGGIVIFTTFHRPSGKETETKAQ